MIIGNKKPLMVIGYKESSMTDEFIQGINETDPCELIKPLDFLSLIEKSKYQYIVSIVFDRPERLKIIKYIDQHNLDLFTVVHKPCVIGTRPKPNIGLGSFVFPNSIIALGSSIGKHCIISSMSMVGHYSSLGDNCYVKPGTMVLGKSTIANNCILNARTTIFNSVKITNNVEIGACCQVRKDIKASGKYAGYPLKKLIG